MPSTRAPAARARVLRNGACRTTRLQLRGDGLRQALHVAGLQDGPQVVQRHGDGEAAAAAAVHVRRKHLRAQRTRRLGWAWAAPPTAGAARALDVARHPLRAARGCVPVVGGASRSQGRAARPPGRSPRVRDAATACCVMPGGSAGCMSATRCTTRIRLDAPTSTADTLPVSLPSSSLRRWLRRCPTWADAQQCLGQCSAVVYHTTKRLELKL
jgi:hypothetical protein